VVCVVSISWHALLVIAESPDRDLDPRLEAELLQDVADVPLDGPPGDGQRGGDLPVAQPPRDHPRDLALARG